MRLALTVAALTCGLALKAHAQTAFEPGFYVGAQGAFSLPSDQDFETSLGTIDTELDTGFGLAGVAGYQFGNGFRSELELSYKQNDVSSHRLDGSDKLAGPTGEATATSGMLNGYFDFDAFDGALDRVVPYVGAGVGFSRVEFDKYSVDALQPTQALDDSATGFSYQLILGVSVGLTDTIDLTADYRYFAAPDLDVTAAVDNSTSVDYETQLISVGIRSRF